jgi:phosphatidylglycerol:prolipoprotein diacylglycerol transferase
LPGDFWSIFKTWEGGLAVYGGIIAAASVCVLYCRRTKIPIGAMLDVVCFGLLIGRTVGRWPTS